MDTALYPAQEPFNENMAAYHHKLIERAKGLEPVEVNYGEDPYQSLGVFPAQQPDGRVLLYFHGGGWTNGYKEWMYFMAPAFNALGITFVSGGYRLAPKHVFPTGFQDCARAVDWLAHNIANYGGDPKKLFVGGHSAGGHYAALLAVTDEAVPGMPCAARLRGAAPLSGTYYFGENAGLAVRPRFLGPPEAGAEKQASPLFQVRAGLPPFFLAWGVDDFPHLKRQALEMMAELQAAKVPVESLELPGCNHFTASYAAGDVGGLWPTEFDRWSATLLVE
ncbi:MAG TPA: alpha/beta hydrolase [Pusillimonas sp.]|uniref:alpha/beta hydrolase n=1 Tax=Pusillimonas sp. TaxID=3040095 RepID=UPI002B9E0201|nr:alpha/beta hydrolase [Pusillimonas sp.]HUH87447.1 alpha/beta hydrolase [Pusillimonas sp.]